MKKINSFFREYSLYIDIVFLGVFLITFFCTFKSFSDFTTREAVMGMNVIMFLFIVACMINDYCIDKYYIRKDKIQTPQTYFTTEQNTVETIIEKKEKVVYEWETQKELPLKEPTQLKNDNPFEVWNEYRKKKYC